jgi:hypothetical protein
MRCSLGSGTLNERVSPGRMSEVEVADLVVLPGARDLGRAQPPESTRKPTRGTASDSFPLANRFNRCHMQIVGQSAGDKNAGMKKQIQ